MLRLKLGIAGSICVLAAWAGITASQTQSPMQLSSIPPRPARSLDDRRETANTPLQSTEGQVREGSELADQPGTFKMAGDRVVFFLAGGKQQLIGLENLNLERIVRVLADNTDPLEWFVTGSVTEFRGTNYLFVRRATFKNRGAGAGLAPSGVGRERREQPDSIPKSGPLAPLPLPR
jgi:hypothetical protein